MNKTTTVIRWMKWALPGLVLLQTGPCTVDVLRQALESEIRGNFSALGYTVAETVFMNLLGA